MWLQYHMTYVTGIGIKGATVAAVVGTLGNKKDICSTNHQRFSSGGHEVNQLIQTHH